VLYNMVQVRIRVCLMQSSLITIVIRRVFRWHRLRLYMESQVFRPDVLKDAEKKVRMIRDNLKIAQSRQKSYADT
jgi:hypothetical protein